MVGATEEWWLGASRVFTTVSHHSSVALSRAARQALGYKEVLDHLDGKAGLDETVGRIQTRTRNFAKRQLTWFRHLAACRMIGPELTFATWGLTIERGL